MISVTIRTVIGANFKETIDVGFCCYYNIQLMRMAGSWMPPGDPLPRSTFEEGISIAQPPVTDQFKQYLAIIVYVS